jgi:hypothetical protein
VQHKQDSLQQIDVCVSRAGACRLLLLPFSPASSQLYCNSPVACLSVERCYIYLHRTIHCLHVDHLSCLCLPILLQCALEPPTVLVLGPGSASALKQTKAPHAKPQTWQTFPRCSTQHRLEMAEAGRKGCAMLWLPNRANLRHAAPSHVQQAQGL